MAYVALQRLRLTGHDGGQTVVMPGQEVPNFEAVSASARWSLLRSHHVVDTASPKLRPQVFEGRIAMMSYAQPEAEPAAPSDAAKDVKGFTCSHCAKPFASKGRLRRHLEAKH